MEFVRYVFVLVGVLVLAAPLSARAQEHGDNIPPGDRPPRGMCRIWINGVPPGQQPAPTDCATAVRRRPPNARVIFGDDTPAPRPIVAPRPLRSREDAAREVRERQARDRRNRQEAQRKEAEREHKRNERRTSPPPKVIRPPE